MINTVTDLQESGTRKIQLTIAINFISSKDVEEGRVMHLHSSNTKVMICGNVNDIVDKIFTDISCKIPKQFRNFNERLLFYFRFRSVAAL